MSDETANVTQEPVIWVLKDERPGTGNQALGVADALGKPYQVRELNYGMLARLPSFLLGASLRSLTAGSRIEIRPPWPDLVISAGRRGASVARYIKQASGGNCFICHLMYPGQGAASTFDLVAVPEHDQVSGPNILSVIGAPHRVTDSLLAQAKQEWKKEWGDLSSPILGVIVGGDGPGMPFGAPEAAELAAQVAAWQKLTGGAVLVTTSRRTGGTAQTFWDQLKAADCVPNVFHTWASEGENPYLGILALSDILIVTGDSVSMLSEACAAPGSVYYYRSAAFSSAKHLRFHDSLKATGAARQSTEISDDWQSTSVNSSLDIAGALEARLGW